MRKIDHISIEIYNELLVEYEKNINYNNNKFEIKMDLSKTQIIRN